MYGLGDDSIVSAVALLVAFHRLVIFSAAGWIVSGNWSIGGRKYGVEPGDQGLLLRQHDHRGIVAGGVFTSEIYIGKHWDGSGHPERYADLDFDTIFAPEDALPVDILKRAVPEVPWDRLQGSGVQVPDEAEDRLNELWADHLATKGRNREGPKVPDGPMAAVVVISGGSYVALSTGKDCDHEIWLLPEGVTSLNDSRSRQLQSGLTLAESLRWIADRVEADVPEIAE